MKKFFLLGITCCILALFAGCDNLEENCTATTNINRDESIAIYENPTAPNVLMCNASAETSAFMFYTFDGETVLRRTVYRNTQDIIDELQNTPVARVTGWTINDITLPIYGIRMGTTCGHWVRAAWSNGFWITQDGDVYRFDFDFEAFIEQQTWRSPQTDISFVWFFPNAINLARDAFGWCDNLLPTGAALNPRSDIEMALVSNTNEEVTFTLTNNTDDYWIYNLHFKIDVRINCVWHRIPTTPEGWGAFAPPRLRLEAGQTERKTFCLHRYGVFPPGTYRLVLENMPVVFEITASNDLMANASAENSAFMFYIYDGNTVQRRIVFQTASHRQGIINELSSVHATRVTDWTHDKIIPPIYGIEMSGIFAAWSNGYWITQIGDVYRFDFDFEAFIERQAWDPIRSNVDFAWFPNARHLTHSIDGGCATLLTPAAQLNPPEGIEMALVSYTNENVTFTLTNNNDIYWMYGTPFRVDALVDGTWYIIPTIPGSWGFDDIGLILEAGQTETKTYGLRIYGVLPNGVYRMVVYDMYVVFEIR